VTLPISSLRKNVSELKGRYSSSSLGNCDHSFPVLHRDGLDVIERTPLILANIIFINACIDGNRFVKIYGQIAPLPRNEEPQSVLLDVSLGVTLFTDDVGIRELLVYGDPVVQNGCIAVNVDDVATRIHSVFIGEGQLPML
jgi:hypothetical protein